MPPLSPAQFDPDPGLRWEPNYGAEVEIRFELRRRTNSLPVESAPPFNPDPGAALKKPVEPPKPFFQYDYVPLPVFTFTRMVSDHKPGEKVRLKLQRGNEVLEKEIALGDRGAQPGGGRPGFDKLSAMGSTVSKRKDDFPSVVQTDLPLQASQCGGPVTDLDGNVIGLVIARSGRVETMILPSQAIIAALQGVDFAKEEEAAKEI